MTEKQVMPLVILVKGEMSEVENDVNQPTAHWKECL